MLNDGIIYPVNQSKWSSAMVVQPMKHNPKNIRVCVDFIWLDKVTLTDPFPSLMDFQGTTRCP